VLAGLAVILLPFAAAGTDLTELTGLGLAAALPVWAWLAVLLAVGACTLEINRPQPRSRLLTALTGVRSLVAVRNRLPLAKSAPSTRAETNAGISPGSAGPSASNITIASPLAAWKPHASALPFPRRVWWMTFVSGRTRRAVSTVPSIDPPSTSNTSWTSGSSGSTVSTLRASLSVGTTMDSEGFGPLLIRPAPRPSLDKQLMTVTGLAPTECVW